MKRALYAVLLLAFVLAIWNTWAYDLWAPDEPFFGEGAREMVADGQWLVPHVNGVVNEHKPPFFFWLIAIVSLPVGAVTSITARFPSVVAGVISVWLTARLGRRMIGERAGVFAGIVMATAYLPWDKARTAQIDAVLCCLVLVALSAFEAFRAGDLDGRRAGIVFWVAGGFATLAKGPVGFLLPLGIALVTLAWDHDLRAWRRFAPWLGPLACLAVLALWAVPVTLWGVDYSLWDALKTHFFNRALHGMHHKNPPWYYLGAIPLQFMPWSLLLPGAFVLAWRRRAQAADRFLLAWAVFVVLFFTASGERRDLYVLPAYPALALLVARVASRIAGWVDDPAAEDVPIDRRWVVIPEWIIGIVLLLLAVGAPIAARKQSGTLLGPAIAVSAALVVGAIALLFALSRRRTDTALLAHAGAIGLVYLMAASVLMPAVNPLKSARPFSRQLAQLTSDYRARGGKVIAYRLGNIPEAISFFSGVYTPESDDPARLAQHLGGHGRAFAVVNEPDLAQLPPEVRARLDVLARADLSRMNVELVANRELPIVERKLE